ncbi:type II secretion system F family protein [Henriciella pelagia]|jgi:tight adherence protein C|uniref:Type II secretion protein F n=1 Tax=Henriciella pelagia TaxID=1977912 RepID=A0ABQ1J2F9_9PROT|nr:type II secretion system F family protein [Henriciella pelagia]GGB55782.1 type II secretion protein F [Henriciella pelagia]
MFGQDSSFATGLAISMVAVIALGLFAHAVSQIVRGRRQVSERLKGDVPRSNRAGYPQKPRNSLIEMLGRRFTDPNSQETTRIRHRLMQAGYYSKSAPYLYIGIRFVCLVAPQLALVGAWPIIDEHMPKNGLIMASGALAVLGFVAPSFLLDKKIAQREAQYREGFPDMMDLMVACVEAGLSLDGAVQRVAEELVQRYPNLADHLKIMNLETRAGRARIEAWKNFADRLGLEEARSLATMLRQSEELGTSVGDTLRTFATDMRERRMLYAEEKALALPAKLVVPLILFVFPSLLTVLMLPAVVRLIDVFSAT